MRRTRTSLFLSLASALFGVTASVSAVAGTPSGIYTIFQHCPYNNPDVTACVYSVTDSGTLKMGSTTLPITPSIVLQGGLGPASFGQGPLYDAVGAPTLSAPSAQVPGGLLGLVNPAPNWPGPLWTLFWSLVGTVNNVTATLEPVQTIQTNFGNALNPPTDGSDPTAVTLAVRAHLGNPFLGSNCYIGSAASPIVLHLQTGTTNPPPPNQPIAGAPGTLNFIYSDPVNFIGYLEEDDVSLVDNSFSVPAASGCGNIALGLPIITPVLEALVSAAVNLKTGLPSAAGKNTAIMNGTTSIAATPYVLASEQ